VDFNGFISASSHYVFLIMGKRYRSNATGMWLITEKQLEGLP
jgi:hypothetical protein